MYLELSKNNLANMASYSSPNPYFSEYGTSWIVFFYCDSRFRFDFHGGRMQIFGNKKIHENGREAAVFEHLYNLTLTYTGSKIARVTREGSDLTPPPAESAIFVLG